MNRRYLRVAILLTLTLVARAPALAADPPSPTDHLGFRPGADFHLAPWDAVASYFHKLDEASSRVLVRELGSSTEGRPFLVAIISSEDTIAHLERYQKLQHRVADPRLKPESNEPAEAISASKPVVLITCSIHSTETASTLMSMELAYDLATKDDAATNEVLTNTILLLVPSVNPDGVDKVASWYERSKGHPWEGWGMPELYHKYAGHDTNRDWFMLNLKETQLLTHLLYYEWFPTLTYDVHQMGSKGARLFVPPFYDPINPNLEPTIHQSIALIGSHMAADLAKEGKKGVLTHALYDNWWNGGNRTTPQRHNIVGVLTEAASVRMASPIFLEQDELKGGIRGFPNHERAINFVDPWPGGWWRLRDIVDYELISARSLLTLAARYKTQFQRDYQRMAQAAITRGKNEPPYAWVVPADQPDPGTAAEMVRILHDTGVEVERAKSDFEAAGAKFPEGSWILRAAQPYRAHLKDMMERQDYPPRVGPGGKPEPPYDVAGWTLPLQMRVRVAEISQPLEAAGELVDKVTPPRSEVPRAEEGALFTIRNRSNDDFKVINALLDAGVRVRLVVGEIQVVPKAEALDVVPKAEALDVVLKAEALDLIPPPPHPLSMPLPDPLATLLFESSPRAKQVLNEILPKVSTKVGTITNTELSKVFGSSDVTGLETLVQTRIGLFQPWVPSMDEGWTRLVLEKFGFPYKTIHNADIRAGDLKERFTTILIPSLDAKTLREGYGPDRTEPAYVGGLGAEGIAELRSFVREGGKLVCLADSCNFAIEVLGLPVKNVLKDVPDSAFYCPGSIVRVFCSRNSVTSGMPDVCTAFFDRSLAFEIVVDSGAVEIASYTRRDVLESGWLLGADKLQGKSAIVDAALGDGHVILFGFPPQHRGQTHGTYRLLFNALLY